ncbi:zinc-binding dehydrogenase, partial [Streptomyces fuscichromogenes]|uniref:zinc-binding dehydrogenase n=1 Tax=Streptomyces fuscichromogenes TaxID=1324013 RepID=UPI0037F1FFFA
NLPLATNTPGARPSALSPAGRDCAGGVAAWGTAAPTASVGDRVMGVTLGAFAPYALVDHRHVIAVPDSLSWTDAAALPVALATEHDALAQGGFGLRESVLVVGATSSVGLIAVQLAKALGASRVIATTTSDGKAETLRAIGADVVVNTASENLAEAMAAANDGAGADLTLDHVGGRLFADTFLATRIGGTVVNVGRLAGAESTIDLDQLSFRRLRVIGTTFSVRTPDELADVCTGLMADVVPAVAEGRIRAVVDSVFAFDDAKAAADRMRSGEAVGKIVLELPES